LQLITYWKIESHILNLELKLELSAYNPNQKDLFIYNINDSKYKVDFIGVIPISIKNANDVYFYEDILPILYTFLVKLGTSEKSFLATSSKEAL
jgi:hypothetical protein